MTSHGSKKLSKTYFDMGIDNGDHFAALGGHTIDHIKRIGELVLIPRKVSLALGMLNVQPNTIARDIMHIEVCIDLFSFTLFSPNF